MPHLKNKELGIGPFPSELTEEALHDYAVARVASVEYHPCWLCGKTLRHTARRSARLVRGDNPGDPSPHAALYCWRCKLKVELGPVFDFDEEEKLNLSTGAK